MTIKSTLIIGAKVKNLTLIVGLGVASKGIASPLTLIVIIVIITNKDLITYSSLLDY